MPTFRFVAISGAGSTVEGRLEARDRAAAIEMIRAKGHLPVEAVPVPDRPGWRERLGGLRVATAGTADLALTTRELALLLQAGQPLERALALLAGGMAPASLRPRLAQVLDRLRAGAGLAESLERAGGFPRIYLAMVRAGEAGGALELALDRLADLLERERRLKEQLSTAMIYPAVLGCVAVASLLLMLLYVVPQFEHLFRNTKAEIPWITSLVLAASSGLRAHWTALMVGFLVLLLAVPAVLRRVDLGPWWDRTVLRLPLLGDVVAMAAVARLSRTLSVLLKAGTPLTTALSLASQVVGNRVLASEVEAMREGVKRGRSLAASLPAGHALPALAAELLKVGEETGRLEEVMGHLAGVYDGKVETALKRFLALLEPAFVILLALLIGGMVVSILLAMVSINALAV
ncbi:MAG TPA: type II secretion system F family protein [Azospirillaceae bacterium]|nr:type II secretion system F family protein [Azospirillaceae bacterium]